jgi:cystathionine beta-synthase
MHAAIEYIKKHKIGKGKRVVVVAPDNIRNYMTKHLNADWMYERDYITEQECADLNSTDLVPNTDWGVNLKVSDIPLHKATFVPISMTCQEAVKMMKINNFDQFPVKDDAGEVIGVLTDKMLLSRLSKQ